MNILITICARGGSKGIPGKNIKPLNGIPLLHYTLNQAFKFAQRYKADIQLSTDSEEILKCAKEVNYSTKYQRPSHLASNSAGKIEAIRDAWKYAKHYFIKNYDFVIDLDVTSPLRTIEDIENALKELRKNKHAINIFSVSPASRNPYFNMVEKNEEGFFQVVKKLKTIKARQSAPKVYDMNASFYIFRKEFMEMDYEISTTDKSLAYEMNHVCFDIDEPFDFQLMELIFSNNLLDFKI